MDNNTTIYEACNYLNLSLKNILMQTIVGDTAYPNPDSYPYKTGEYVDCLASNSLLLLNGLFSESGYKISGKTAGGCNPERNSQIRMFVVERVVE